MQQESDPLSQSISFALENEFIDALNQNARESLSKSSLVNQSMDPAKEAVISDIEHVVIAGDDS